MFVIRRPLKSIAFAGLLALTGIVHANPIFGDASVVKTTAAENKQIIGKSSTQDLYGYYGNYYATVAIQYGSLGLYYHGQSNAASYYSTASNYAYYAYVYYYYAAHTS